MTEPRMSKVNAARMDARLERDRPKISEVDIEEYRRVHYPKHVAEAYVPGQRDRPAPVPGDKYIAQLSHEQFHGWFGTECDETCPHARSLPTAVVRRAPWWRWLFGGVR